MTNEDAKAHLNIREKECWRARATSSSLCSNCWALEHKRKHGVCEASEKEHLKMWRSGEAAEEALWQEGRRKKRCRRQRRTRLSRLKKSLKKLMIQEERQHEVNATRWGTAAGYFPQTIGYVTYVKTKSKGHRRSQFLWGISYFFDLFVLSFPLHQFCSSQHLLKHHP